MEVTKVELEKRLNGLEKNIKQWVERRFKERDRQEWLEDCRWKFVNRNWDEKQLKRHTGELPGNALWKARKLRALDCDMDAGDYPRRPQNLSMKQEQAFEDRVEQQREVLGDKIWYLIRHPDGTKKRASR